MRFNVGNNIYVHEPTQALRDWCKSELTLDNPEYHKKVRMGLWLGSTPENICLYEKRGDDLILPFGCVAELMRLFPDVPCMSRISPCEPFYYASGINLYPYQERAVKTALKARNGVIVMPCGAGKGLPIDAKVCTPTGWKRNGDLRIGDAVVGSDGKVTKVTGIFDRGKVEAYKITFSDGVETVCDKDHLWTVQKQSQRAESGNWDVMNTQAIYAHYQNMKCRSQYLYIPIVEPVEFNDCENRKMDSWLLGFLLGDGCFQKSMITMSTNEDDLREKVIYIIGRDYGSCEWLVHKEKYDWRFCGGYVLNDIRALGLGQKHSYEKFIPTEYLIAPVGIRLAVLQGLFDADGHIANGKTYEYSTTSKQLADDVVFIVESLGGTAKVSEKTPTYTYNGEKRKGRKAYRIFFKLYKFKPFTSKKHFAAYRERTCYSKAYRIIKKIEPCDPIVSRCITVDAPDQLYVTEHFVVTHNTQTALQIVSILGVRTLWLTHTQDLLNQSLNRAKSVLNCVNSSYGTITGGKVNIGSGITFATVQTMSKLDLAHYRDVWGCVIVDECMPGDTKIATPYGFKLLKNLCNGDIVTSYNRKMGRVENRKVIHTFKRKAHNIVNVNLSNGEKITCTGNHPIFTKRGWMDAERLKSDDYVMRMVWEAGRDRQYARHKQTQSVGERMVLLFKRMLCKGRSQEGCLDGRAQKKSIRTYEEDKRRVSFTDHGKNDEKQPYEKSRYKSEGIKAVKRNWASSKDKMRKWSGADSSSTKFCDKISRFCRCIYGISNTNKNVARQRLSDLLQSRYSNSRENDCNRNRRKFSLYDRTKKTGREKRAFLEWVGVESVEIQKQTSDGTFGGMCSDGYVYNIEVENNNNYFADGYLVHNCHKAVGGPTKVMQFYKVLSNLSCRYKFGLTATPKRADGLEKSMFALIGDIICEVSRDEVKDTTCPVKVEFVETGYMPNLDMALSGDGTINYAGLVDDLIENTNRFNLISNSINKLNGSILVLGNRVKFLQKLNDAYKGKSVCLSALGNSKAAKAERKEALRKLDAGEISCVFATYQLAREGLDIPNLRYVVFATPEKDPTTVQQAAGRVGRKAEGKQYGTVIDFVDDFGMYKGWQKKRTAIYKKLGYEL